eukprot:gene19412-biopygen5501
MLARGNPFPSTLCSKREPDPCSEHHMVKAAVSVQVDRRDGEGVGFVLNNGSARSRVPGVLHESAEIRHVQEESFFQTACGPRRRRGSRGAANLRCPHTVSRSIFASPMHPPGGGMRPPCILGASSVHPRCILGASSVHPRCILRVPSALLGCTLHAPRMRPHCVRRTCHGPVEPLPPPPPCRLARPPPTGAAPAAGRTHGKTGPFHGWQVKSIPAFFPSMNGLGMLPIGASGNYGGS